MPTITITGGNHQSDVIESSKPVLIDFWAEWCGPCKQIGPSLEELSNELAGEVTIGKVNIEEEQDLATKYGVRSIPALALIVSGEVVDMKVGAAPKARIAAWIKENT
jgi:thioredoxin 1